ncbi:putative alpha-amylase, partial [Teratosphaeria nubilosa]
TSAASLDEWRDRTIYQIVTDRFVYGDGSTSADAIPDCAVLDGLYCGGTWKGIQSKLDYIQGMNFDAIWISPAVANLPQQTGDGEAYTGYWQQDLYALNPHFGTAEELNELVEDLHARGMYLMLDIVVNHMGWAGVGWMMDYAVLNPFNDQKYYHEYCVIEEEDNQTIVELCYLGDDLVTLADLRTEDQEVQDIFGEWISQMVSNYSIDGLRIDTSINVNPSFFTDFVNASGVFAMGEVMQGDDSLACEWEATIGSILNYPIYYTLTRAFESSTGSINDLTLTIESVKQNCKDPTVLGSFSENHDVARFANATDDLALAKNIIAYTVMADGIPIIYQGQEQHMNGGISPYFNRAPLWTTGYDTEAPLYEYIATLNTFRQWAVRTSEDYTLYMNEVIYEDLHNLAMRKGFDGGQVITVLSNNGQDQVYYELAIDNHGYPAGIQMTEVLTCTNVTVNQTGFLNVGMMAGTPKILYPTDMLYNSSLCEMPDEPPATATP